MDYIRFFTTIIVFFLVSCNSTSTIFGHSNEFLVNYFFSEKNFLIKETLSETEIDIKRKILSEVKFSKDFGSIRAIISSNNLSSTDKKVVLLVSSARGDLFRVYSIANSVVLVNQYEVKYGHDFGTYMGCNEIGAFYCIDSISEIEFRFLFDTNEGEIYYSEFLPNCDKKYFIEIDQNCSDRMISSTIEKAQFYFNHD